MEMTDERAIRIGNRIAELLWRTGTTTVEDALTVDTQILGSVLDAWGWTLGATICKGNPWAEPEPFPEFFYDVMSKSSQDAAIRRAVAWETVDALYR